MSSEQVERTTRLQRTDPSGIARQLREELKMGGVSAVVISMEERTLFLLRDAAVQEQIDLRATEDVKTILDPVDLAMETVEEMNVSGLTLREALFEIADQAAVGGGVIVSWACGSPHSLLQLLERPVPRLQSQHVFLLNAVVRRSENLGETDVLACIGTSMDDPTEVVGGLLFRLDDLTTPGTSHERHPVGPDRERTRTEGGSGSALAPRPSRPPGRRPVWAGPAPE